MRRVFILTDGKNYVMRNPMHPEKYMATTSSIKAEQFTYKQARTLLKNKKAALKWVKTYRMVDLESGKEEEVKKTNEGAYCGNKDIQFDDKILNDITQEVLSILGTAGWDMVQLTTHKNLLNGALSKCDSAESDVKHALEWYKETHDGKNPQAHKVAKLGYMLADIREKHRKIKQCILYVEVMQNAITYKYTLEQLKQELSKVKYVEYKGRTEYYKMALDILEQ